MWIAFKYKSLKLLKTLKKMLRQTEFSFSVMVVSQVEAIILALNIISEQH